MTKSETTPGTPTVLKYDNGKRVMFFEPGEPKGDFIPALRYMNNRFLETGTFELYSFIFEYCTQASEEETAAYLELKKNSKYLPKALEDEQIIDQLLTLFEQSKGYEFRVKGTILTAVVDGVDRESRMVISNKYGSFAVSLCELTGGTKPTPES